MSGHDASVLRHFDSDDEVLELQQKEVVADRMRTQFPLHARYEYLWMADRSLVPSMCSPFISPFIYRGQVARYRPCLPSVFRGLSREASCERGWESLSLAERARLFIDRVRLEEFLLALCDHPALDYAEQIGLCLQPYGLAQHYEMATDQLDLTQDRNVAAFFATNQRIGDEWVPAEQGDGVIYRVRTNMLYDGKLGHIECVGKQPLPRPEQQKAFTLRLPLAYDFERLNIEVFTFRQVKSCSQRLNDLYQGGSGIFPPDVMADVAASIRSEDSVSMPVMEWLMDHDRIVRDYLAGSLGELYKFVSEHSDVRVSTRGRITLTESQKKQAEAGVELMNSTFLENVGASAVRDTNGQKVEYCCLRTRQKVASAN